MTSSNIPLSRGVDKPYSIRNTIYGLFMRKLFFLFLFLSLSLQARDFQKILIPNAQCGNGLPYHVFYSQGKDDKLLIELMGGGACWSLSSCYGPNIRTWLHQIPTLPSYSVLTSGQKERSPFYDRTVVYFPYCTGDVYAGRHIGEYALGVKAYHVGYRNISLSLDHLFREGFLNSKTYKDLVLFGASAGALGSLIHGKRIARYFDSLEKKTLLADSPGLHWGEDFWDKFTPKMIRDIDDALGSVGLDIDRSSGLISPSVPKLCGIYRDWSLGFFQGSQDVIMTYLFGNINPKDHEELVYSDKGIFEQTKNIKNCSSWVPSTKMHTFLLLDKSAQMQASGVSAMDFVRMIYNGETSRNFK